MTDRVDSRGGDGVTADILGIGLFAKTFDRELIDSVLQETGRQEKRVRLLPAHVVVHLVLGLALHADQSYAQVVGRLSHGMQQITGGHDAPAIPTVGAITAARTRLGSAPLVALFNRAALPLAKRRKPLSLLVVEACSAILNAADSPANAAAFGYSQSASTPLRSTLPQVKVVTLTEAGTQATIGAALGPSGSDTRELAARMAKAYLWPGMLLVAGRQLFSPAMWAESLATGASLLWTVENTLPLPVLTALADGTYLSEIPAGPTQTQTVRVLTCIRTAPGESPPTFRLISSLLHPADAPAEQLVAVYARRAAESPVFRRFNTERSPAARPLRSRKPDLVRQEIWGHLLSHYAIRAFINRAADEMGAPADRDPAEDGIALVRRPGGNPP